PRATWPARTPGRWYRTTWPRWSASTARQPLRPSERGTPVATTRPPDKERVGSLRRVTDRSETVMDLREQLAIAEERLARAINDHGADPPGLLPLGSAGRE